MKVRIIKGTNQIGGCITEISSNNTKIIIDFGEDLPDDNSKNLKENPNIDGLTMGIPKYDAVFITHSHGDHIGMIEYILPEIPVYVENISKIIYNLLADFTYQKTFRETINMEFRKPVKIKDITIRSFIVDHSSYNSSMLLIELNGKKILHTGDFRNHGKKGKIFESTLKKIGKVDLLITEGTSLSRIDERCMTEEELSEKATDIFKKYNQVFILQSSTNIDRISSLYKASRKTKKTFIEDLFTSNITCSLGNEHIPNPKTFPDVYTWIPAKYLNKNDEFKKKYIIPYEKYKSQKAYINMNYALMVKTSMLIDIKKLNDKGFVSNACLIYSMWDGYKKKEEMKSFLEEIEKMGIKIIDLHTSGHADKETIKLLNILNANKVIPIHTTNPEGLMAILPNVIKIKENEEIEV